MWREIRSGKRSPSLEAIEEAAHSDTELVETFVEIVAQLRPRTVVDNAIGVVAEALADAKALGGMYDLLCPTSLFAVINSQSSRAEEPPGTSSRWSLARTATCERQTRRDVLDLDVLASVEGGMPDLASTVRAGSPSP